MEFVELANVDTSKFFSQNASKTIPVNPKWKCSDFALKMLEEGVHADITLRAQGGSVKAHKCVLACVSPVFSAMFQHNMKEKLTSIVDISDMTIDALQLFLLLLYTTKEVINDDMYAQHRQMPHFNAAIDKHFNEIHKATLKYQVESRLGSVLLSALARKLTPENCWFYYSNFVGSISSFNQAAYSICIDYVLGNYYEVIESTSFVEEMRCNSVRIHRVIMEAKSRNARKDALERFFYIKEL